jgi:hypothetical protein
VNTPVRRIAIAVMVMVLVRETLGEVPSLATTVTLRLAVTGASLVLS